MSTPPPPAGATAGEMMLPYGRTVRRRVAVPLALALGLAVAITLAVLHDPVVYYRVDSGSMQPTLPVGTRVAIEPGLKPTVGEIVVFHAPRGALPAIPVCGTSGEGAGFPQPCGLATPGSSRVDFVKRIVAGPGDRVLIRAGRAVVNGATRNEPYVSSCESAGCNFSLPVRVPPGQFYVLGDNRGASDDSRFWGPVPASSIIGVLVSCGPLQTDCQPQR